MMPISHDHTKILGKRISQIAWDKAHILKPHTQAVIARQNRWAKAEITTRSKNVGIKPMWFGEDYAIRESNMSENANEAFDVRVKDKWFRDLRMPLLGLHQRQNAAVAITAADCFLRENGRDLELDVTRKALSSLKIPGRLEWGHRDPDVLLDVAHNPASFKALVRVLDHVGKGKKIRVIIGFARGKDSRKCLKILAGHVHDIVIVPTGTPRSQDSKKLLKMAQEIGIKAVAEENGVAALSRYLDKPDADLIVVTGSFPLVGDCRNYLLENQS
jgi:dihydrofolate synthase/folylpolyglutamate synthase